MMNKMKAFSILQIEPTEDKKQIKKAYASLVKMYHPEEQPQEWKKIREAYEAALFYAERGMESFQYSLEEDDRLETPVINYSEQGEKSEFLEMFEQLDELVEEQKWQEQDTIFERIMSELEENAQYIDVGIWKTFFDSYDMKFFCKSEFLYRWADVLLKMELDSDLRRFFNKKIYEISKFCKQNQIVPKQVGTLEPLKLVDRRINREKTRNIVVRLVLFVIIYVAVQICTGEVVETEYDRLFGHVKGQSFAVHVDEFIQLMTHPILDGYYEEIDFCMDGGLQTALCQTQENFKIAQSDVFYETDRKKIENGIVLHDGVYLSGWENEIQQDIFYEEITDIEELEKKPVQNLEGKDFYAVELSAEVQINACAVCFIPEKLGLDEDCKVYYSYGGKYREVLDWTEQKEQEKRNDSLRRTKEIYGFRFYDYRAFAIVAPAYGKVTLLFVNEE